MKILRQGPPAQAIEIAEAARALCQSFLETGKLSHQQHLALRKSAKAEVIYSVIATFATKLLADGCQRAKLVSTIRERWNEGLPVPVRSASTIRQALKAHNI